MMSKRNLLFFVGLAVGLGIVLMIFLYGTQFLHFFSLETLQYYARDLLLFAHAHYYATVFIFLGVGVITITLFLPTVTLYMIAAGFLFGPWVGALYAVVGITIGSICAFLLVRSTVGKGVHKYEQRLLMVNHFIKSYGFYALVLLRMSHLIPFFLLNIAAGLVSMPLFTFTAATLLGIIPGSLLFAWSGQYLCSIHSIWDLINIKTLVISLCIGAVFISFALITTVIMRRRKSTTISE